MFRIESDDLCVLGRGEGAMLVEMIDDHQQISGVESVQES